MSIVFRSIPANSIHELHAGTNQRQKLGAIEVPPAKLRHIEQLERHQQSLGSGTGAPGRALAQAHGGERRLDHIGGTQVLPMLGGEVEE